MRSWLGLLVVVVAATGCTGYWTIQQRHPTVRIMVATGCPAKAPVSGDVRSIGDTSSALVPARPTAGLICRYQGTPEMRLYLSLQLDEASARLVVAAIDRGPTTPPRSGSVNCPVAGYQATIFAFAYKSGPDFDIWWYDTGCTFLDNGNRAAAPGDLLTVLRTVDPSFRTFYVPTDPGMARGRAA